ncbi:MAG: SDR family oxidoreductase [Hyphomicrobiales bacterium]|nr:SDR family oxidoreductase [Hyphomicrobiales bacterium]MCP5002000.1 SDR family oxidoreductase [Hyphomicrobiales bacterium]
MRVALTGGATGIGAAVAAKLKTKGATVVAFDLNEPQKNVDRWIAVDLSNPASISKAVAVADDPLDALINNAGLPPRPGLEGVILSVNFLGLVQFTNAMIPKLNKGSAIVNTASRAGAAWRENIEQVKALFAVSEPSELDEFIKAHEIDYIRAYNLSKEAVIVWGIAQTERLIAMDLRMNSVSPAAVSTAILDDFETAFGEKMAKNVARVGRPGLPEEIADLIVFLVSNEGRWLKGNDFTIDGGMSALAVADQLGL